MCFAIVELNSRFDPFARSAVAAIEDEYQAALIVFVLPLRIESHPDSLEGRQRNAAVEDRCTETFGGRRLGPDICRRQRFDREFGGEGAITGGLVVGIGKCVFGCHSGYRVENETL